MHIPAVIIIGIVTDNNSIIPRRPSQHPTIPDMVLNITNTPPSGIDFNGNTFPTIRLAFFPQKMNSPVYIPSAETMRSSWCLNWNGWRKVTRARGRPDPDRG
ncbi:hypothetical protein RHGRI_031164 [Rhododendron griersonianum]|uniref:Uncharacterized protein n=1 Tax=Rhododendron griersonianum TaxID=479676 RepID=A0AAV6I7B3_9ERIC|nr:hypothetical protein RHGRI_031164 [Rhododendron griersonianum]